MRYNGELSVIDTQEKAYLLGQIYGDGNNNCKPRGFRLILASIIDDKPLYERLAVLFPFLKMVSYSSHPNVTYLVCTDKQLCFDLEALGMSSPKKPKDVTGEFHFPNLRDDLIHHFIRGYFDADGAAYLPSRKRSRNNLRIEFGCATPTFLKEIQKVLKENDMEFTWYERNKKAGNGKYYYSYTILSSNQETSRKFADYIYKDATLYLDRKHEICYTKPNLKPTMHEIYGNCPYCGGINLISGSYRDTLHGRMQRILCKDCNKRFQKPMPTPEVTQDA